LECESNKTAATFYWSAAQFCFFFYHKERRELAQNIIFKKCILVLYIHFGRAYFTASGQVDWMLFAQAKWATIIFCFF